MRYLINTLIWLILIVALTSCSTIKTTITEPDGSQYQFDGKSDALIELKKDDVAITVDNRGKRSLFEDLIGVFTLRWMREDESD